MALSLEDNPAELFLGDYSRYYPAVDSHPIHLIARLSAGWFGVNVKSRQEKSLAHWLAANEIPYFLPLRRSLTPVVNGTSRNRAYVPVLPGFLFAANPEGPYPAPPQLNFETETDWRSRALAYTQQTIRRSRCVWGFLNTPQKVKLAKELALIASETKDDRTLLEEPRLPKGTKVLVIRGPFQDLRGVVGATLKEATANGKVRLSVNLHLLGRVVSVEVDRSDLEPL